MSDDTVIASRRGRIGHLLLNRPKALNALDTPMLVAMTAAEGGMVWSRADDGWQMSAQLKVGHALAGDFAA